MAQKKTFKNPQERQEYWGQHVTQWQASGLTQEAYSREHGLEKSAISYWKRKLMSQKPVEPNRPKKFVEISSPTASRQSLFALQVDGQGNISLRLELAGALLKRFFDAI